MKNINFKKILISIVLFVITIELSSRIDDWIQYDAPLFGTYNEDRLRTEDDEAITCNVPNISYEKWSNNSLGFRGPELRKDDQVKNVEVANVIKGQLQPLKDELRLFMKFYEGNQAICQMTGYTLKELKKLGISYFTAVDYRKKEDEKQNYLSNLEETFQTIFDSQKNKGRK